jgi:hypothetical protein
MAQHLYALCMGGIIGALLALGYCDLRLSLNGEPTVTDYLRAHPWEWWVPVGVILGVFVVVSFHLFWRTT